MSFRKKRSENDSFPWAKRAETGVFSAFVETTKKIFVQPAAFFKTLERNGNLKDDLLFAAIMGTIPSVIIFLFFLVFSLEGLEELRDLYISLSGVEFQSIGMGLIITVTTPLQVIVSLFIFGGLIHIFLRLFGWRRAALPGTIRALSYSTTAGLAGIFPLVGGLIGTIWGLILQTIGIKTIHKLTAGKAFLAIISPLLAIILLVAVSVVVIGLAF